MNNVAVADFYLVSMSPKIISCLLPNVDFCKLTKTHHHPPLKGTSHDFEDSQFATKTTFDNICQKRKR